MVQTGKMHGYVLYICPEYMAYMLSMYTLYTVFIHVLVSLLVIYSYVYTHNVYNMSYIYAPRLKWLTSMFLTCRFLRMYWAKKILEVGVYARFIYGFRSLYYVYERLMCVEWLCIFRILVFVC